MTEAVDRSLTSRRERFSVSFNVDRKGAPAAARILTRKTRRMRPPYDFKGFMTPKGGHVSGLGMPAAQKKLKERGMTRALARRPDAQAVCRRRTLQENDKAISC